jgi:hypothetical protein
MELESLLERQGYTAIGPASAVARALTWLGHERLDAALLDLNQEATADPDPRVARRFGARTAS